jgi:RHH-type rel operon transcriptional repressor/antitoxin RelB
MATTVWLKPSTEQRLDQLAQLTGRTKAFHLRQLIVARLDDLEDAYLGAAVAERGERTWLGPFESLRLRQEPIRIFYSVELQCRNLVGCCMWSGCRRVVI